MKHQPEARYLVGEARCCPAAGETAAMPGRRAAWRTRRWGMAWPTRGNRAWRRRVRPELPPEGRSRWGWEGGASS